MKRTKQIAVGFLVILSLFVSSVAACCCSHQQEKQEVKIPSCHQPTSENETSTAEETNAFETPCGCLMEFAPKVFGKTENIKIEKQAAKPAFKVSIKFEPISKDVSDETFDFSKPFYLSDSFYRHKSPRAPPVA